MLGAAASAQNPIRTTIEVEMNDGKIQKFESNESVTFSFLGTKGTVQVPVDPQWSYGGKEAMETDNVDIYARIYNLGAYSATVYLGCSNQFPKPDGFVISKTQNAEPDVVITSYDLFRNGLSPLREDKTVEVVNSDDTNSYTCTLSHLGYNTTYYLRPYVMIPNASGENLRMYGEELKFSTPKTVYAALDNEPETAGGYCWLANGVVVSKIGLKAIYDAHAQELRGDSASIMNGIVCDMTRTLSENDAAALPVAKTIECVDGTIKLVNTIPAAIMDKVWKYMNSGVTYAPEEFIVNRDVQAGSTKAEAWASDKIMEKDSIVSCTPDEGLPHNAYMLFEPVSSSSNPLVSIEIQKSLLALKYRIDVTFAPAETRVDEEGQAASVPNRLNVEWYYTDGYGKYSSRGVALSADEAHTEGRFVIAGKLGECDTASFEITPDQTTGKSIIKLSANITSTQFKNKIYTRTLRIAEIKVTPIE